jgi:aspartyl-tRNA synthetase
MVLNGNEIGGGSIRIHDKATQLMFKYLGFTEEEAKQFGFLMDAFQFGAPPHGVGFWLDRLVAILGGQETIRTLLRSKIGRDVMIDAPSVMMHCN